jgi:hypothetical protein
MASMLLPLQATAEAVLTQARAGREAAAVLTEARAQLQTASGAVTASHYFPTTEGISYETIDFARLRLDLPRIAHYSVPSQMGVTRSHASGV